MKLVVVGGAPYADEYIRQVRRSADPRVVFPGYVFGRRYWELQRHAYLFCAPTEVGGTHPVILEAMAAGNCVLVNDHPPNVETVGDAGVYFSGRAGASTLTAPLEACSTIPSAGRWLPRGVPRTCRPVLVGRGHRPVRAAAHQRLCGQPSGAAAASVLEPDLASAEPASSPARLSLAGGRDQRGGGLGADRRPGLRERLAGDRDGRVQRIRRGVSDGQRAARVTLGQVEAAQRQPAVGVLGLEVDRLVSCARARRRVADGA